MEENQNIENNDIPDGEVYIPEFEEEEEKNKKIEKSEESDKNEQTQIPPSWNSDMSLLEQCLSGKPDVFRSKVLNIMLRCRINNNDPIFLLLLCLGELELILIDTPLQVQDLLEQFAVELSDLFNQYFGNGEQQAKQRFETALAENKTAISEAALELIKINREEQFTGSIEAVAKAVAPALLGVILAMGLGSALTFGYMKLFERSTIDGDNLTVEQYNDLKWLETPQGQNAKNIATWNAGYFDRCQEDAQTMGFRVSSNGRRVKNGYCVLYVIPPEKRKYEERK